MIPNFTEEEKALIRSVQAVPGDDGEPFLGRMPCIRSLSYLMARANTPEVSAMMDRAQNKLGMMTDFEYSAYDFSVDEEDPEEESDETEE